jgi:hypothetical protein
VGGQFTATATKKVTGLRNTSPPIVPTTRTAANIDVSALALTGFSAYSVAPDGGIATQSTVTGSAALNLAPAYRC